MNNIHIFLVVLLTLILIIIAEKQNLRKISWILLLGCITYIFLLIEPETSSPNISTNEGSNSIPIIEKINEILIVSDTIHVENIFNKPIEKISEQEYIEENIFNVEKIVISSQIIDKNPIDENILYFNDINSLYCYTAVANSNKYNKIVHVWKYENNDYLKSYIKVGKSPYWRCWSKLNISSTMVGDWQVIATDTIGNHLDSIEFSIIDAENVINYGIR